MFDRDSSLGQFVRFCAFGVIGAGTNYAVFIFALAMGVNYVIASFLGWFIGLIPVFVLNRLYTFRSSGSAAGDFIRMVIVYLAQQLIVVATLAVCVEYANLSPQISYFVALPIAVATSFLGSKFYALRKKRISKQSSDMPC